MGQVPQSKLSNSHRHNKVSTLGYSHGVSYDWFFPSAPLKEEYRPESGHYYGPSPSMSSRGALPPTPPMQSDGGFDGRQSPSQASTSSYSVVSAPSYYFNPSQISAINNMEPHAQRQPAPAVTRRVSMPVTPMSYTHSPFNGSYTMSPGAQSLNSYYPSPIQAQPAQVSGLYYQRPLPQVCLLWVRR